jgi:cation/acetate symporter
MAHDLYVGVLRAGHEVRQREQVVAARLATLVVGAMAIAIGIAAKGQNVAVLVALAFAVAASANFPCILLTLYWKRCNTGGIVAGMIVGTLVAVGLTLVSPNLSYPKAIKAAAQTVVEAEPTRRAALAEALASGDATRIEQATREAAALDKALQKAREDLAKFADRETSLIGLEEPLVQLRNPGLISIPLGFLAVFLGSLLYRDRRAAMLWDEMYARQNTGIRGARATSH